MPLAANLVMYIVVSLGAGFVLRSIKDTEGSPRLRWYIAGLVIGIVCGLTNTVLASNELPGGYSFNLDVVLGSFLGALGTGLLIGIPVGLISAYDMMKRFTLIDGWLLFFKTDRLAIL